MDFFTTLFERTVPTPTALMRMTTLVFMLQGIIAWGVLTYSFDGISAADEDLSSGITTTSEFPQSAIMWTLTALVLSAWTGRNTVVDIMGYMFVTVPFKAFVETLGFVLLVLMNAHFYGLAERCLSTAVAFAKTRRYADNAQAIRHKARARGLTKKLLVKSRLARVVTILDIQSCNLQAAYRDTIKLQDKQLSSLKLLCNDFQRSNTATQGDFSHYMWSAERQIDGLTARNAQLETSLACLGSDVQTCHQVHDLLQTDLLCTIRDSETTLGKKDAEICSLTKDNVLLRNANDAKYREIERLKAQLLHSKEVDGTQDIADRSTEPPSPSLHSRWGSADSVDGASIFRAGNNSAASKTPCGRKAPNASAAIIAAAAARTFVYSKASRRATDKSATNAIATSAVSNADRAATEALIADARLEACELTMRRAATSETDCQQFVDGPEVRPHLEGLPTPFTHDICY